MCDQFPILLHQSFLILLFIILYFIYFYSLRNNLEFIHCQFVLFCCLNFILALSICILSLIIGRTYISFQLYIRNNFQTYFSKKTFLYPELFNRLFLHLFCLKYIFLKYWLNSSPYFLDELQIMLCTLTVILPPIYIVFTISRYYICLL